MVLLPLVLVGSMLFWTVAFGLGGLSLLAATGGLATGDAFVPELTAPSAEPMPGHVEPITVHIEESAEPEDVNDNAGAAAPQDEGQGQDEPPASAGPAPGTRVIFKY
jgi:hypothetical protein